MKVLEIAAATQQQSNQLEVAFRGVRGARNRQFNSFFNDSSELLQIDFWYLGTLFQDLVAQK